MGLVDSRPLSLRSLPPLAILTAAEAIVFEQKLGERSLSAGESVVAGEELLLLREGEIRLETEGRGGKLSLGKLEKNGLLGEEALFVSETPILAEAETDVSFFAVDRQSLKNAFRYSRTGAVKFLGVFGRSLAQKIRAANDLLQEVSAKSEESPEKDARRPAQLTDLELHRLQSLFVPRSYEPNAVVFREGDMGEELFVIRESEVEILNRSGRESMTLARLGTGNFFGELAFIDRRPRSAHAVARSQLDVYVLPAGSLKKAVEYNVGTALYLSSVICKIMARRLNETLTKIGSR